MDKTHSLQSKVQRIQTANDIATCLKPHVRRPVDNSNLFSVVDGVRWCTNTDRLKAWHLLSSLWGEHPPEIERHVCAGSTGRPTPCVPFGDLMCLIIKLRFSDSDETGLLVQHLQSLVQNKTWDEKRQQFVPSDGASAKPEPADVGSNSNPQGSSSSPVVPPLSSSPKRSSAAPAPLPAPEQDETLGGLIFSEYTHSEFAERDKGKSDDDKGKSDDDKESDSDEDAVTEKDKRLHKRRRKSLKGVHFTHGTCTCICLVVSV